ncbi:hypothetical protein QAD02_007510 [Eretmocerus hayati]|uniref:Uncharacterized protein n=1 Tax=Eretmocerus hayati TaxID=131215 RepID=A0ACC2N4G4_9HYME|nr:hypothetical protein QAD02_007510 [Eretmocerus hayati]
MQDEDSDDDSESQDERDSSDVEECDGVTNENFEDILTPDAHEPLYPGAKISAKALFMDMKLCPGFYGCQKSKIRGETLNRIRVFPFKSKLDMRTTAETEYLASLAEKEKSLVDRFTDILGVKGRSVLSQIVYKYIETTSIDVMHCVFINLTKKLLTLWFGSRFSDESSSMRTFLGDFNAFLKKLRPTDQTARLPRSLDDFMYWKASEWKNFLLVYSLPLLEKFMPKVYFDHHILLVHGISLLSMSSVTQDMMKKARACLSEYVKRFGIIYGKEHMISNIHLLLHLADVVEQFGPLWVTSCFPFEALNGVLKGNVHGSQKPELQIASTVSIYLNLNELRKRISKNSEEVSLFCEKVFARNRIRRKTLEISDHTYVIGSWLNNMIIESDSNEIKKTDSSCIRYITDRRSEIAEVKQFVRASVRHSCEALGCKCTPEIYAIISKCRVRPAFSCNVTKNSLPNFHRGDGCDELTAIKVSDISSVCYKLYVDGDMYIVEPCNNSEVE